MDRRILVDANRVIAHFRRLTAVIMGEPVITVVATGLYNNQTREVNEGEPLVLTYIVPGETEEVDIVATQLVNDVIDIQSHLLPSIPSGIQIIVYRLPLSG